MKKSGQNVPQTLFNTPSQPWKWHFEANLGAIVKSLQYLKESTWTLELFFHCIALKKLSIELQSIVFVRFYHILESSQRKAYCSPSYKSGVNIKEGKNRYLTLKLIDIVFLLVKIVKQDILPLNMIIYLKKIFYEKKKLFWAFLEHFLPNYCISDSIDTT